jgi:imidazolonepropionase-like amidohydrolase
MEGGKDEEGGSIGGRRMDDHNGFEARIFENGAVAIRGNKIVDVGKTEEDEEGVHCHQDHLGKG